MPWPAVAVVRKRMGRPELVAACQERDIRVMVLQSHNNPDAFRRILEWQVDMVNLNHADAFLAVQRAQANALTGLRAVMPDTFSYDEMLNAPLLMQPLGNVDDFRPRPLTDIDVGIVQEHLQNLGLERISKDVMHQAVDVRAQQE